MNNATISIIIPIYNVEAYLDQCIQSVVNQTYPHLEIILVDDGSTDDSSLICDNWGKKDSRIHVIHTENAGPSAARNAGLSVATGAFVAFVDSDDYLDSIMMETLLQQMQDPRVGIVECSVQEITGKTIRKIQYQRRKIPAEIAVYHLMVWDGLVGSALWNKLFRRSVVQDLRFMDALWYGEDTPYLYQALCNTELYVQLPYDGYFHLRREDSLVGKSYRSYKIHSVYGARWVNARVDKDFSSLAKLGPLHVAINALAQMHDLFLTEKGRTQFGQEYRELLSALRECDSLLVRQNVAPEMYMRWLLCSRCPLLYEWMLKNRTRLKAVKHLISWVRIRYMRKRSKI